MSIAYADHRQHTSASAGVERRVLHRDADLLVEDVLLNAGAHADARPGQVRLVLSYRGILETSDAAARILIDANQAIVTTEISDRGLAYAAAGASEHGAVVITLLNRASGWLTRARTSVHSVTPAMRLAAARLLSLKAHNADMILSAVRDVLDAPMMRPQAPRVVDAARLLMQEHEGQRRTLAEIASILGVTPSYLTQEFTRSMGMPLYQYQMRLRLTRALLELPECVDITELALALGFSSHSHFSATFKAFFGITPSTFRDRQLSGARS